MSQARVDRAHRAELRLLIGALVVVSLALVPYDLLLLRDPTPARALVELHVAVLALASVAAAAVLFLGAHRDVAAALAVGAAAGAVAGFALSLATGTGFGEELDGLVFRVLGAAVVGLSAGISVRVLEMRHRLPPG